MLLDLKDSSLVRWNPSRRVQAAERPVALPLPDRL
jgi:hypothetical protein